MMIKNPNPDFLKGRKILPFHKSKITMPAEREWKEGLSFRFKNDETGHESEIAVHKSTDSEYLAVEILRTTDDPELMAGLACLYTMEQIACMKWLFEHFAGEELEAIYQKLENEYLQG
jgi:hypothetical protein